MILKRCSVIILLLVFFTSFSCTKKSEKKKSIVTFTLKDISSKKNKVSNKVLSDPPTVDEVNCFAILVSYPELDFLNYCDLSGGGTIKADHKEGMAPFSDGAHISMEVEPGESREFFVIGWSATGECVSVYDDLKLYEDKLSEPFLLGKTISNIDPGTTELGVSVIRTIDSNKKVTNCYGNLFRDGPGIQGPPLVGLVRWYDASDLDTVFNDTGCTTLANFGDDVKCWADKSDEKVDATQPSAAWPKYIEYGLKSMASLRFDGASSYLKTGLTTL